MPHAHLTLQHLLRQLELHRGRTERPDRRPAWLVAAIERAAELFHPLGDLGRVGFDCRPTEEGWVVDLFLGGEERVGGPLDGLRRPAGFRFDLQTLTAMFETVSVVDLEAADLEGAGSHTRAVIRGRYDGHPLTFRIHAVPPEHTGAGWLRYPNGQQALAD